MKKWITALSLTLLQLSNLSAETVGFRSSFFEMIDNPWHFENEADAARYINDGLLIIEDGYIKDIGFYHTLKEKYPCVPVTEFKGRLVIPGFIDTHVHYCQLAVLGAFGNTLLEWLQETVFPEEQKFTDINYARKIAKKFFKNCLQSGTTTMFSYATTSPNSVIAFFDEATKHNMRVICGVTGLDREGSAPPEYLDTPETFYRDSKAMIERYHNKGRNLYGVAPRFADGCTAELLTQAERLLNEYEGLWFETHISETPNSTRLALELFPESADYLNIYESFDLIRERSILGHGVYLSRDEFGRISDAGASVAHCPRSNLFLGSGLFKLGIAMDPNKEVLVSIGSDMGGGDSLSMLQVLNEVYKVNLVSATELNGGMNLQNADLEAAKRSKISAYRGIYLATLGGARALRLEDKIGSFKIGNEADFIVLDLNAGQPTLPLRQKPFDKINPTMDDVANLIFGIMTLGDDRTVDATYIMGELAHSKD